MGGGPVLPTSSCKRTYTVLVTGFGPFPDGRGGHYDTNASHLIARALPSHLKLTLCNSASTSTSTSSLQPQAQQPNGVPGSLQSQFPQPNLYPQSARIEHPEDFTDIRINIVHPSPTLFSHVDNDKDIPYVPTEYAYTRSFVQALHSAIDDGTLSPRPDLILHLGQASAAPQVAMERLAFSQSMRSSWWSELEEKHGYYRFGDDKGETIEDVDGGRDPWAEQGVPMGLVTAVDIDAVLANVVRARTTQREGEVGRARVERVGGWQAKLGGMKEKERQERKERKERDGNRELAVVTHHEAGPYMCGFICYESLAQCYVRGKRADVMFCHVPLRTDEESVARGRDAICDVLGGVVEWMWDRERKEREKLESEKEAEEDSAVSAVA